MGTVSDKLTYLNTTKGKIKDSINLTGAGITDQDTFRSYETKLKDGFVGIINNGVDTLYENFPKVAQTGEEPTLNGVYEAPMRVDLNGNTEQSILPSGYTQVDYIESSGSQYIDTGIKGNQDTKVNLDFEGTNFSYSGNKSIIGSRIGATEKHYGITMSSGENPYLYSGYNNVSQQGVQISLNTKYNIFKDKNIMYLDNTEITNATYTTFETPTNMFIFAMNEGGAKFYSSIKLFKLKIYNDNELVRDFIPCYRNSDNVVGLYDLVNGVFYTNQGTGAFTYGSVAPTPDSPLDIRVVKGDNTIKVTGKNLFDGEIEQGSLVSGANSSTTYHLRSKNYISIEPNQNYAFSVNGTQNRIVVNYYDKNKQWINTNNNDAGEISSTGSVTSPSNAKYMRFRSYRDDYNLILNGNIQIEQSSTATPYQPYQEQTYQLDLDDIELCKIGDYKDEIRKSTGKNLFDITQYPFTENKSYGNDGEWTSWTGYCAIANYFPVKGNTTYTFSNNLGKAMYYGLVEYDENKTKINYTSSSTNTFTTLANTRYIRFAMQSTMPSWVQIEENPTATDYEPYGKVWYKKGYIGKVQFSDLVYGGTGGNFSNFSTNGNIAFYYEQSDLKVTGNRNDIFCNLLKSYSTTLWNGVATGINNYANDTKLLLSVPFNNVEQYAGETLTSSNYINYGKNYIASLDGNIYYLLAKPTGEEITDTTLIEQLEALKTAKSVEGQTNITQINEELPFILDVSGLKKD